ncbi:hypothetical protein [Actinomyces timonensis]|jgi:hypothetical protein|uniref:hypothetical protein n=1 Tax=Actinomyces timonensis TaxID=1288391 RepID=UPI0012B5A9AD|nr:hypothetical protein [Actinomyces timonensis]
MHKITNWPISSNMGVHNPFPVTQAQKKVTNDKSSNSAQAKPGRRRTRRQQAKVVATPNDQLA